MEMFNILDGVIVHDKGLYVFDKTNQIIAFI